MTPAKKGLDEIYLAIELKRILSYKSELDNFRTSKMLKFLEYVKNVETLSGGAKGPLGVTHPL